WRDCRDYGESIAPAAVGIRRAGAGTTWSAGCDAAGTGGAGPPPPGPPRGPARRGGGAPPAPPPPPPPPPPPARARARPPPGAGAGERWGGGGRAPPAGGRGTTRVRFLDPAAPSGPGPSRIPPGGKPDRRITHSSDSCRYSPVFAVMSRWYVAFVEREIFSSSY